jgi:hypothetical protein
MTHADPVQAKATKKDPEITVIHMDDGRDVDFVGQKKLIKTHIIGEGSLQIRLDWVNGESRMFTLSTEMLNQYALFGAGEKISNEMAGVKEVDDCVIAVDDLIERLKKGEWAVGRTNNGMAGTTSLIRALVEHTGKSVEDIKAFVVAKNFQEKAALREHPHIKAIITKLEAGKKKKAPPAPIDTDALLGELAA